MLFSIWSNFDLNWVFSLIEGLRLNFPLLWAFVVRYIKEVSCFFIEGWSLLGCLGIGGKSIQLQLSIKRLVFPSEAAARLLEIVFHCLRKKLLI